MESCVDLFMSKENGFLYTAVWKLFDMMPLLIGIVSAVVIYKIARRYMLKGSRTIKVESTITSVEEINPHERSNGTHTNDGIKVTYQYEYNGQIYRYDEKFLYSEQLLTVGGKSTATITADNPGVHVSMQSLNNIKSVALAVSIFASVLFLSIFESIGTHLCR